MTDEQWTGLRPTAEAKSYAQQRLNNMALVNTPLELRERIERYWRAIVESCAADETFDDKRQDLGL
jgi:hypothetical protein